MGWQDELRRLDAELADGHISHDQHRKLRDELLASASGGAMVSPRVSPLRRSDQSETTTWRSTNPGREAQSAPEPAAEPAAPEPAQAEPVKPPSPAAALLRTNRQTTAPSPADHRRTESMPYPLLDQPTQVLSPVPALPPLAPSGRRPPRLPQQPRPTRAEPRGQRTAWVFISLGVLLVLALIIGGAWWLGRSNDDNGGTAAQPLRTSTVPDNSAEVALEDRLPALPGTARPNNSTLSIDKGVELGLYSEQAAAMFGKQGVQEVIYRGSSDGTTDYLVLLIPASSANTAEKVLDYLHSNSLSAGFVATEEALTVKGSNENGQMRGSWYLSGNVVVATWVSQPLDSDASLLATRLANTIESVRRVLPES